MFKLQRPTNRPSKQRDRLDFKFSNFQALQVPKGWDRLFVSVVSAETGKTIAKLGKALVKNGSCHWTESVSESIYISRNESSKGYEDCLVKLVVSAGSTRPNNTLGEATINLAQHATARASAAVSLPLKKCSYGSILQVKIQRFTPRSRTAGDDRLKNSDSHEETEDVDHLEAERESHSSSDGASKPPRDDVATSSRPLKSESEEASESASGVIMSNSFCSVEGSHRRGSSSAGRSNGGEDSPSNQSAVDFRDTSRWSVTNSGSSRNLLEAAEDTIEELRAEAKMWERNARKLMVDLDISRKELFDVSKKQADLGMELSAAYAEQDGLRRQVERMNAVTQAAREDPIVQTQSLQKELESEIKFQQDLNDDLSQQLKRSQESNIELVSVLQELEETIEQQRTEIANLKADAQLITDEPEKEREGCNEDEERNVKAENDVNLVGEIESLRERIRELEKDCTELTDENLELLFKLKDSNKTNIRKCSSFDSMTSEHPTSSPSDESEVSDPKLDKEQLKEVQIAGFESCLHFAEILEQLDIAFHLLMKPWYGRSSDKSDNGGLMIAEKVDSAEMSVEYIRSLLKELNKLLETRNAECDEILGNHQHDGKSEAMMRELEEKRSEIVQMEADMLSKEEETNFHSQRRQELEAQVSELQQKSICLEQDLQVALRERKISSECLETLQGELTALSNAVSSHISTNTNLERNIEELQIKSHDLENSLSGLQEEKMGLQQCISDLEAQVQQLKDEKRLCLLEIENYKSSAMSLKDEMHIQISDLKQKLEDIRKQWLEAQEECGHLKEEKKALQASSSSSVLETAELRRENQELQKKCSELVNQLSETMKTLSACNLKVESLQSHLTSVQDDFVQRENHLKSDLDALLKENSYIKEKLAEEVSLRQVLLEKTTEFESLQENVEYLSEQLFDAHREREKVSAEVSCLLAEKAEMQTSLQEVQSKVESAEKKLDAALQEYELKVEDLTDQLTVSSHSHEKLMIDHERILKLLATYRKTEEKLKTDLNDLELKHTISVCERQQLTKEMSILKVQLQSISDLQDEVSTLKSELKECKLNKGKLELALNTVTGDYDQLKAESISLSEKISIFEDAVSEFEECKRKKLYLEEKLVQVEKDLSATEILCIQNADLKNELAEMKRVNMQYQQKMYTLEEEKHEWLKKAQTLEENLKLKEERDNIHKEGSHDEDVAGGDNLTKKYGGVVARERYERTKSSLETELRDLKERYLEMSLKYAEVEEQREDLVMKLKATRSGKRWLSVS